MIYQIYPKPSGAYGVEFAFLNGDPKKVETVDRSVDIGINPPSNTYAFRCGRWVHTEHLPTRIRPKKRKGKLPDYVTVGLAQIASERMRDVIETHDPGRHQFVPVTMVWKDGTEDERRFYWFIPGIRLRPLDPATTYPPLNAMGYVGNRDATGKHYPPPSAYAFRRDLVGDNDLFCIAERDGVLFVSQRLKDAIETARISDTAFGAAHPLVD